MKIRSLVPLALPAALFAALIACTTVPETGRKRLSFVNDQSPQIKAAALSQFEAFKKKKRISRDPRYTAPLARVAAKLTRVIDLPGAKWEFVVFEDPNPNAFALPGGKVGVHTGLFKAARNEAQLAAVVGHEIGHVVAGHAAERMSHKTLTQLGGALLGAATKNANNSQAIARAYGMGAQTGVLLPFSRTHELEADKMGALYMARAGYDPRESVTLWKNMAAIAKSSGKTKGPEFLSTHPLSERRIQELNQFMPRALQEWKGGGATPVRAQRVAGL